MTDDNPNPPCQCALTIILSKIKATTGLPPRMAVMSSEPPLLFFPLPALLQAAFSSSSDEGTITRAGDTGLTLVMRSHAYWMRAGWSGVPPL